MKKLELTNVLLATTVTVAATLASAERVPRYRYLPSTEIVEHERRNQDLLKRNRKRILRPNETTRPVRKRRQDIIGDDNEENDATSTTLGGNGEGYELVSGGLSFEPTIPEFIPREEVEDELAESVSSLSLSLSLSLMSNMTLPTKQPSRQVEAAEARPTEFLDDFGTVVDSLNDVFTGVDNSSAAANVFANSDDDAEQPEVEEAPSSSTQPPCSFCPDGIVDPDLVVNARENATCATFAGFAASLPASNAEQCDSVRRAEATCCPPGPAFANAPTDAPSDASPTASPSAGAAPTEPPSMSPIMSPIMSPTKPPSEAPTETPSRGPSRDPSKAPTAEPTAAPTREATAEPTTASPVTAAPTDAPPNAAIGEMCTCSPLAYTIRLSLDRTCDDVNDLANNDGIESTVCMPTSRTVLGVSGVDNDDDEDDSIGNIRRRLGHHKHDRDEEEEEELLRLNKDLLQLELELEREAHHKQIGQRDHFPTTEQEEIIVVTSVQFLEFGTDPDRTIIHQDDTLDDVSLRSGDAIAFQSVAKALDPSMPLGGQADYLPGGVQVTFVGRVDVHDKEDGSFVGSAGIVIQRYTWGYTNACYDDGGGGSLPVADGDRIGWITFEDLEPASPAFCPIVPALPATTTTEPTPTEAVTTATETSSTPAYIISNAKCAKSKSSKGQQHSAKSAKAESHEEDMSLISKSSKSCDDESEMEDVAMAKAHKVAKTHSAKTMKHDDGSKGGKVQEHLSMPLLKKGDSSKGSKTTLQVVEEEAASTIPSNDTKAQKDPMIKTHQGHNAKTTKHDAGSKGGKQPQLSMPLAKSSKVHPTKGSKKEQVIMEEEASAKSSKAKMNKDPMAKLHEGHTAKTTKHDDGSKGGKVQDQSLPMPLSKKNDSSKSSKTKQPMGVVVLTKSSKAHSAKGSKKEKEEETVAATMLSKSTKVHSAKSLDQSSPKGEGVADAAASKSSKAKTGKDHKAKEVHKMHSYSSKMSKKGGEIQQLSMPSVVSKSNDYYSSSKGSKKQNVDNMAKVNKAHSAKTIKDSSKGGEQNDALSTSLFKSVGSKSTKHNKEEKDASSSKSSKVDHKMETMDTKAKKVVSSKAISKSKKR